MDLLNWQDRFIPDALTYDESSLHRSRFFVSLFVINIVVMAFAIAFMAYNNVFAGNGVYLWLLLAWAFLWYGMLVREFYLKAKLMLVIHLFLATTFIPVFINVFLAAVHKYQIGFILLPLVVVAFNLGGRKVGYAWAVIAMVMQVILIAVYNGDFPRLINLMPDIGNNNVYSALHVCFLIIASTIAYETIIGQVMINRDKEREIFRFMAQHDPLTHLSNNLAFEAHYLKLVRADSTFVLIYIDLNDFKYVNDTFGHTAGDRVLCTIADRIQSCVRDNDVASRLSGDEFGVMIDGLVDYNKIHERIELIGDAIAKPITINDVVYLPKADMGYAIYPDDANSYTQLINTADYAMYEAKALSRA